MRAFVAIIFALILAGAQYCALAADSYTGEMKLEMMGDKTSNVMKLKVQHKGNLDRIDLPLGGELGTMVTVVDRKAQTLTMYNPASKQGVRQKLGSPMGGPTAQAGFDLKQTIKQLKDSGYNVVGPTVEGSEKILGYQCTVKKIRATKGSEKMTLLFWMPEAKEGRPETLKGKVMGAPMGTMIFYFTSLKEGASVSDSAFSVPSDVKITDQTKKPGSGG